MDVGSYLRAIAALAVVIALMFALLWLLRRHGFGQGTARPGQARRLSVVETLPLDSRHRLILVRRDGTEHLLLVGGATDLVVEHGCPPSDPAAKES